MLFNYCVKLQYKGDNFLGFQKCKEGMTIEGEIQPFLEKILLHPVKIQATSRTDKGVHAEEQYINFFTNKELDPITFIQKANSSLPKEISFKTIEKKEFGFHPTLDVIKKRYRYQFSLKSIDHHLKISSYLDLEKIEAACDLLVGQHNFFSFCCKRKNYQDFFRTIHLASFVQEGDQYFFTVEGDQFLNKMVRMLACAMLLIGTKKMRIETFKTLLKEPIIHPDIQPLSPNALFLEKIFY